MGRFLDIPPYIPVDHPLALNKHEFSSYERYYFSDELIKVRT